MSVIEVNNIVKDYGNNRGVFDVSFDINKGEVFGFLGPNGAGKTTTIRQILGFIKPDSGSVSVNGQSVWGNSHITNAHVGYLPGEINFPDKITEKEMIRYMAEIRGLSDISDAEQLMEYFELKKLNTPVKKMSKGMKQKIGLVCAFMGNPDILILDEPTSGLDPLMQDKFVRLVKKAKENGKTVLMSSHMFGEVEKTCDKVAIIRQGKIVSSVLMSDLSNPSTKLFVVKFKSNSDREKYLTTKPKVIESEGERLTVSVDNTDINLFISTLSKLAVQELSEKKQTLEDYFMRYYSIENQGGER